MTKGVKELRSALLTARNVIFDDYEAHIRSCCSWCPEGQWPDKSTIIADCRPLMMRYERALKKIHGALGVPHKLTRAA